MLNESQDTEINPAEQQAGIFRADPFRASDSAINAQDLILENPEDLRQATRGADLKIVQLARGHFKGRLTHAGIEDFSVSAGDFGPDIRARGVMNPELVTLGTMLESSGEVTQWGYDVLPGDIVLFPQSVEQEGRFTGLSRYVTITLSEEELAAHARHEGKLQEPDFWTRIYRFRTWEGRRAAICRNLARKVAQLRENRLPRSKAGIDFFRRSIIEIFLEGIIHEASEGGDERHHRAAKLVRNVEDYVDMFEMDRPVHISELCAALSVSRRALHRAFQDIVGVGPVAYLRLRRLSAIHQYLKAGRLQRGSITQLALEYGFDDPGRFAGYYRRIFNESPSQSLIAPLQSGS
ncbi:MAG TPA: helix-turn-helix transcriptional regulator [Rhizobiaceae bacterium]|nr:helix-turn-helix transcriptional regulator [Rhizobiaceae bacterium]